MMDTVSIRNHIRNREKSKRCHQNINFITSASRYEKKQHPERNVASGFTAEEKKGASQRKI